MSENYRMYDDRWRVDPTVTDQPYDVSTDFNVAHNIMDEIATIINARPTLGQQMEHHTAYEMAQVVFGSNQIERLGADLDETKRLCMSIFRGDEGLEYVERSDEYQQKLDNFLLRRNKPGEKAIVRSRREVVQHAAAFQFMINAFVKQDENMTETLIKETHAILTKGLSAEDAGFVSAAGFGGTYRSEHVFAGVSKMTKPANIAGAMKSMIAQLQSDLAVVEATGHIDPFMLAATYCDRFINIHPFKDANGRMCRIILNVILVKYAGVVVPLGEKGEERDEYLAIAQESTRVAGHPGQLGTLVLAKASKGFKKMLNTLKRPSSEES
ncbi:uncharacterized protein KY384_005099 [Bacidia gigantensis]|uniref:uncharacterized protein n=1 Tax=Bacidia gigantensis TaxID=2732470 RepID=UPI001D046A1C|nr:uncharacterized protein KY384_005099 [Bacidia gigantensis]KAG8530596.1 hypothetical protein KY384_005099 [Bacidia gigantensis]